MSETPRAVSPEERNLLDHVTMWGSDSYPVQRFGRRWHWVEFFGVKGAPTTYKTKREAIAAFSRYLDILIDALGQEAKARGEKK